MTELQLRYAFLPSISPLVASPKGGTNPVLADLVVIISNPNPTGTVTLYEITIDIPVGEDAAATLSTDVNPFSTPDPDEVGGWKITGAGSTITLKPDGGGPGTIAGAVLFKLPGIRINTSSGTVQLTVSERSKNTITGKYVWNSDPTTYTLVKQPNDYVITNFSLDPKVLDDIDLPVRLFWTTTDAGKDLTYKVRSEDWAPKDVHQRADGITGVAGPTVDKTRTFTLDAFTTDGGSPKLAATAEATIVVEVPGINQVSTLDHSPSGFLVSLRWLATNARGVQVILNDHVVDEAAPVDTYHSPYSLVVPGGPAQYQVALVAHAVSGDAKASLSFPDFMSKAPVVVPLPPYPYGVAVTEDVVVVLTGSQDDPPAGQTTGSVCVLDRTTGAVLRSVPVPIDVSEMQLAPGPGPRRAFVTHGPKPDVTVVDIDAGTATRIPLDGWFISTAFTPDGALALVTEWSGKIVVIDVKTLTVEKTPIQLTARPTTIVVTPDGKTAIASMFSFDGEGELMLIDIATRRQTGKITLTANPWGMVITPDGSTLLATISADNAVLVVDLATGTAEPREVAVGTTPNRIAITPDGRYAITTDASTISVIDVARRMTCATIPFGSYPRQNVAISADGICAAVCSGDDSRVVIF